MSYKRKPPTADSESQDLWMDVLKVMGGQFWPPELEEEDMPQVGARFPMMLYNATLECIVYDEEEYEEAKGNGYKEHPSMETPGHELPKPLEPEKPAPKVTATVSVQKTVEVKPKTKEK